MHDARSFYITTPIYYPSDVPHIGHGYTSIEADAIARWHRQAGDDTWMLTGTDEHGQKMIRAAAANGYSPQEWVDKLVAEAWEPLLDTLDIANDDFIRTTQQRHVDGVQKFFSEMYERGHIYAGEYEALYCVGCEEFKPESEIVAGTGEFAGEKVCSIHSKPLELLHEKNYFFRLSDFQDRLLALYRDREDFVQPQSARNEVVAFVEQGLKDLSISRSAFDWGVEVPWDPAHVIYVWVDALLNYVTAVGYGTDDELFQRRWPAHHLVGKDILRFHAVIWPALLMAAGIEVPKSVFAHGWLLVGGEKMSKSKLTGIAPRDVTDTFGSDAFRYYLLSAISFGQDGSFSWEDLAARYQAELANGFGNLASRTIAMITKYFGGTIPSAGEPDAVDLEIQQIVAQAATDADDAVERFRLDQAIAAIWRIVDALNGYITDTAPWVLAKDDAQRHRLETVLATCAEGLRALTVLLSPVMPSATEKLWSALGVADSLGSLTDQPIRAAGQWGQIPRGTTVRTLAPLFPRVEQE